MTDYVGTYRLDARPDRIDLRDRIYAPPLRSLAAQHPPAELVERYFPYYEGLVLHQGREGACTGFGLAATINYLLWERAITQTDLDKPPEEIELPPKVSARMLYHLARFYDEWPGEDYEGSSCRGAVKAWHKHGVCSWDLWPYTARFTRPKDGWEEDAATRPLGVYYRVDKNSVTDLQAAIQDVGAVYASARVHTDWNLGASRARKLTQENLPRIPWKEGATPGDGHAFALVGYNRHGFIVQNSWGPAWGLKGFAVLGYDDWAANGTDAWTCVMGAPTETRVMGCYVSRHDREASLYARDPVTFQLFKRKSRKRDPWTPKLKPWGEEQAYRHTVVMGNDGRVINRLVVNRDGADAINELVVERPSAWLEGQPAQAQRIAIYAHGGLNSEGDSIQRIRTMAPYFDANGIYPLFLTWRTGFLESILSIMGDATARLFPRSEGLRDVLKQAKERTTDVLDRTLEVASENLGVKSIWSQMKQNASAAALAGDSDRGSFLTVKALTRLKKRHPELKIHLVGHSAGSILLGHMLDDLPRNRLGIATCTLYAAACSVEFANRHYAKAVGKKVLRRQDLQLHVLSDARELDDTVGPYQKSLLYLVSRALEDWHKTPLLGMAKAFGPKHNDSWSPRTKRQLELWQGFWGQGGLNEVNDKQVVTAAQWRNGRVSRVIERIDAAHGAFDNDVEMLDQTLRRITGRDRLQNPVEDLRY